MRAIRGVSKELTGERQNRWLQALIVLLVLIAAVYLLQLAWQLGQRFAGVLILFLLAWMIAFMLSPVVETLRRAGVPRRLAVVVVYVVIALLVVVVLLLAVPALVQQINVLAGALPLYSERVTQYVTDLHNELAARGVTDDYLLGATQAAVARMDALSTVVMRNSLTLAGGVAAGLFDGIIVLILSFYMTLDGDRILVRVLSSVPPSYQRQAVLFMESVAQSFGGFLRAQLLLAIISGVITGVVMRIFGLNYVLTTAVVCGLVMLVPLVGNIVALVPPVMIAVFQAPSNLTVVWVLLVLWAAQQIMLNVLVPRLLSESVGLHPLLVFFSMLLGASAAGPWGAIFGVPVIAVICIMWGHCFEDVLAHHPLYAGGRASDARGEPRGDASAMAHDGETSTLDDHDDQADLVHSAIPGPGVRR